MLGFMLVLGIVLYVRSAEISSQDRDEDTYKDKE